MQALGNRCVDFGGEAWWAVGGAVIIYGCNGSAAQWVTIAEIDTATHDVELRVQDRFCFGVRGGIVTPGQPLELQTCVHSAAQRFAIDGDAILVGTQANGAAVNRAYVIEPQQGLTPDRTPLVVGTRDLSDAEYFRFNAVDGSGRKPTTGFVRVTNSLTLDAALTRGWGTVIEVDDAQPLVLTGSGQRTIHAGTTLRGYRKFTYNGPEVILGADHTSNEPAFLITEKNVRVTGLRMRGRADDSNPPSVAAFRAIKSEADAPAALLDHMDIGYWTLAAVDGFGPGVPRLCCVARTDWPPQDFARAVGNLLHHVPSGGYNIVMGGGAFITSQGNVFYANRQDIVADPWGGYAAYDNLVLGKIGDEDDDFDVHGSLHPGHWFGGMGGDAFDIGWNSFLSIGPINFNLRGTPCRFVAFHDNMSRQSQGSTFASQSNEPVRTTLWNNKFGSADPTPDLAVGDFDGDGLDDVFMGTGAGWYFSSGGQAEWRFLNRMPELASQLKFGDFDGDRRTDVIALHGTSIDISWAGGSAWQPLNSTTFTLADLAVGDFDHNGRADLFVATGTEWLRALDGNGAWEHYATSVFRTNQLRFGDFDGDQRTDVLGVVSGSWQYVPGNGATWTPLRSALAAVAGLVVGDFDGDGIADLAGNVNGAWQYSKNARDGWVVLRTTTEPIAAKPIGRFDANASSDVILWSGDRFVYAPRGRDTLTTISRQAMR